MHVKFRLVSIKERVFFFLEGMIIDGTFILMWVLENWI
jgi:hypothetical protein